MLLLAAALFLSQDLPASYGRYCAACHGDRATGTDRGPLLLNSRPLRSRSLDQLRDVIRNGTRGGMPAFAKLPAAQVDELAGWIRQANASAFDARPPGDAAAGARVYAAQCQRCHMANGVGQVNGPDLTSIGRELTVRELEQTLDDPASRRGQRNAASCPSWAFCPDNPWTVVNVTLARGGALRGFARARGPHDLQLQTFDGRFHLLAETEWTRLQEEPASYMPAFKGPAAERRDLLAYLATLGGPRIGALAGC